MKNKTLPLLVILPFVIGILSVLTIQFAVNIISEDLRDIAWEYRQNEGFQINTTTKLVATQVGSKQAIEDPLNALVWTISTNEVEDVDYYATVSEINNDYFITTHNTGKVTISVKNIRGTLARSFNGYIYETGVILINPKTSSTLGIEDTRYIGEYDYFSSGTRKAHYPLLVETVPASLSSELIVDNLPDGITYMNNEIVVGAINNPVELKTISFGLTSLAVPSQTYDFAIVKDGVNVYTYDELLLATNEADPKIVVQQIHFESLQNTYDASGSLLREDTTLFGHYDFSKKEYSFDQEVYRFKTTYSHKYIDDWNSANSTKLTDQVVAGLHIQKDYYGNGFSLNGHNLTFPYDTTTNNEGVTIATLNSKNLFRGPLSFVALGNPTQMALINAYGQDNTFLYVDGNNITLRDINVKNADFGNNLNNLNYTGTGIEINGNNISLINSQVRNARTNVRIFDGENTIIKNSFISTARQFLVSIGSNEYVTPHPDKVGVIYDANGNVINDGTTRFSIYFRYPNNPITLNNYESAPTTNADGLITNYLLSGYNANLTKAVKSMNNLMNQTDLVLDDNGDPIIKTDVTIEDSYFYQSGIASIALESMFNGPFLYNALPSIISSTLEELLAGVRPNRVGGISYPAKLTLVGDTSFFDYKTTTSIDPSSLLGENISSFINETELGSGKDYTIDDIFPIRSLVEKTATAHNYNVNENIDDSVVKYINIPIIYFGGGVNESVIDTTRLDNANFISDKTEMDLLVNILQNPASDTITRVMQRSVLTATGFSPFYYHAYTNAHLYKVNPNIAVLKSRA